MNKDIYELSPHDKKMVVGNFINFKEFKVIDSTKHSPDKFLSVLLIDGKTYVLVVTDYFNDDDGYESREINKIYSLNVKHWLRPKNSEDMIKRDDLTNIVYALALV